MKTKDYYNKIAKGYDELYGKEQLRKWNVAKKLIRFSKKDNVLDVGCGTGIITQKIARYVNFVVGLDISEEMIKRARLADNITYIVGDARHLPFEDKKFDKVVSFTVIQDIRNWDKVLKEMKRVSKGIVLLTVLKRNKKLSDIKRKLSKYFKIKKFVEEEKDYIFLLSK
ncbi:MAG: class I SAM-dependent methyltransferase [Nanoarchaeota archaeon]|nr:class I SAM-dependent methyltransferase [Nanoarchaeota archaeon]